jgi:hypothetical protein
MPLPEEAAEPGPEGRSGFGSDRAAAGGSVALDDPDGASGAIGGPLSGESFS